MYLCMKLVVYDGNLLEYRIKFVLSILDLLEGIQSIR